MRLIILVFFITACAKKPHIKHTEYLINGVWRECFQAAQEACGIALNCKGEVFKCMNNLETRSR